MVSERGGICRWFALFALPVVTLMPAAARELTPGLDWFETVPDFFPARSNPQAFVHEGKIWVIGGNDARPFTDVWSGDGTHWTRHTDSAVESRKGFAATGFNGRLLIMGGARESFATNGWQFMEFVDEVWSSDEGSSWTEHAETLGVGHMGMRALEWNGSLWRTGGYSWSYTHQNGLPFPTEFSSAVMRSTEGRNWNRENQRTWFTGRGDHAMVVFKDRLWVIGGRGRMVSWESTESAFNDVWSTADGVNWTSATLSAEFAPRYRHGCAVLGDKIWVFGGLMQDGTLSNEAWNSTDGIHWTRVVPDPPFLPREGFTCVVLDGVLWVIGGGDDGLWYTTDGINWQLQPSRHPGGRSGHATFAHGEKIWLIGGYAWSGDPNGNTRHNDIWNSVDGVTWTRVAEHASFPPIGFGRVLNYEGKLWLFSDVGLWNSIDALNWSLVSSDFTSDDKKYPFIHEGEMWTDRQVSFIHSSDGIAWTESTLPFPGAGSPAISTAGTIVHVAGVGTNRVGPEPALFDNRVWAIGGEGGFGSYPWQFGFYSTVRHSSNGIQWEEIKGGRRFCGRSRPGLVASDSRLFVIGGSGRRVGDPFTGSLSDVWYTYATGQGPESDARSGWTRYE